jgi:hypothetical protein
VIGVSVPAAAVTAIGLAMVAASGPLGRWAERRRNARLDELDAGGRERVFEEGRSLRTYGPNGRKRFIVSGLCLTALGLINLLT